VNGEVVNERVDVKVEVRNRAEEDVVLGELAKHLVNLHHVSDQIAVGDNLTLRLRYRGKKNEGNGFGRDDLSFKHTAADSRAVVDCSRILRLHGPVRQSAPARWLT